MHMYSKYLDLIEQHIYHFFLKIVFERLSNSPRGSDVLLFLEFINIVSFLLYNLIEFILLLYTFLVNSFARYKKCMICLISFSKLSDVLPAFFVQELLTMLHICLGVNILSPFPCFASYLALDKIVV